MQVEIIWTSNWDRRAIFPSSWPHQLDVLQRPCADVNYLYKQNAELTQSALYINHYSESLGSWRSINMQKKTEKTSIQVRHHTGVTGELALGLGNQGGHIHKIFKIIFKGHEIIWKCTGTKSDLSLCALIVFKCYVCMSWFLDNNFLVSL